MPLLSNKSQEEINQKKVRSLLRSKENKKCFDCPTKGPSFVNTTIQTFICTRCSGLVREVGHRVKAISASKFSGPEVLALEHGGNEIACQIWLSNYNTHDAPEPQSDADVRAFMRQKYYELKWLNAALLQSHKEKVLGLIHKNFDENGVPLVNKSKKQAVDAYSQVPLIANEEMNIMQKEDVTAIYSYKQQLNHYHPSPYQLPNPPLSPTSPTSPYKSSQTEDFDKSTNQPYLLNLTAYPEPTHIPAFYTEQRAVGDMLYRRNSSRQSTYSNQDSFTTSSESIRSSTEFDRIDQSYSTIIPEQSSITSAFPLPSVVFPESTKSMPMLNFHHNSHNLNTPYPQLP
ncbi:hypothetical protein BDF20DRAFT_683592 [Mycotypha africana]|uniref:uncharacterized protein n=1 Tax=Mycotypha africana TaxID=64632 RepID=UPI0023015245|nr:uncharacterized protein BDF20DRAFT_683592 [Mycotypha africana]KAI8971502.1 hypothetical protein BDF20DRAFT_683592 [Mycotypha africana]